MEIEMDWCSFIKLVHRTSYSNWGCTTAQKIERCLKTAPCADATMMVIGWKDSSDDAFMWWEDYFHKAHVEEILCVYFFSFVSFVYVYVCVFSWPYTQFYICPLPQFINAMDVCLLNKHVRLTVNCVEVCMGCSKATDPAEWSLASLRAAVW